MATSILVVHDDPIICIALKNILNGEGHGVVCYQDPHHALPTLSTIHFDLVIMNLLNAFMLGGQFSLEVKRIYPTMPVLMISNSTPTGTHGADKIISGQFTHDEIVSAVNELLKSKTP